MWCWKVAMVVMSNFAVGWSKIQAIFNPGIGIENDPDSRIPGSELTMSILISIPIPISIPGLTILILSQ